MSHNDFTTPHDYTLDHGFVRCQRWKIEIG